MKTTASTRLKKVLRLVDELELDSREIDSLCDELSARKGCVVDLSKCRNEEEKELVLLAKSRIESIENGSAEVLSEREFMRRVREHVRNTQKARQARSALTAKLG